MVGKKVKVFVDTVFADFSMWVVNQNNFTFLFAYIPPKCHTARAFFFKQYD